MCENQSSQGTNGADVEALIRSAPGGSLADLVAHHQELGAPAMLSAGGTQAWVPGVRGELQRFPLECTEDVEAPVLRTLLRYRGIWLVSFLREGGAAATPNCFDYVSSNPEYEIDRLNKNARRDIRRGLRRFLVRLCTADELAQNGAAAHADTFARHGYTPPASDDVRRLSERYRNTPFHEIWGAWRGDRLCAWMTVIKIDDWAMVDIARSCTDALGDCPNNAILYKATRRLLVEEKRRYVTYGLSSIQVNVSERSMHKYKLRMGYEARPLHRKFVLHPLPRTLFAPRLTSWMIERLAQAAPQVASLRKLAGMSRLVSGRERTPLAWADDQADTDANT